MLWQARHARLVGVYKLCFFLPNMLILRLAIILQETARNGMFTVYRDPTCCITWTLEGSPHYRGGSCVICIGQASAHNYAQLVRDQKLSTTFSVDLKQIYQT